MSKNKINKQKQERKSVIKRGELTILYAAETQRDLKIKKQTIEFGSEMSLILETSQWFIWFNQNLYEYIYGPSSALRDHICWAQRTIWGIKKSPYLLNYLPDPIKVLVFCFVCGCSRVTTSSALRMTPGMLWGPYATPEIRDGIGARPFQANSLPLCYALSSSFNSLLLPYLLPSPPLSSFLLSFFFSSFSFLFSYFLFFPFFKGEKLSLVSLEKLIKVHLFECFQCILFVKKCV